MIVHHTLTDLDLRRENKVGINKFQSEAYLGRKVVRFDTQYLVRSAGAGIGRHVIIKAATQQSVKTEVMYTVTFKF
ncbi:hypothetical protein D9M68_604600 [compost metagenome]